MALLALPEHFRKQSYVTTLITMMQDRARSFRAAKETQIGWLLMFNNNNKSEKTLALIWKECGSRVGISAPRLLKPMVVKNKARFCIIVSEQNITHGAKKECIKEGWQNFTFSQLKFPVAHHSLVPHHRRLDADEKKKLLSKLKIKESQLPLIYRTDSVCQYYDFREGDVLEIHRKNGFQQPLLYYRYVVA